MKTKLIPFDLELFKQGAIAVTAKGTEYRFHSENEPFDSNYPVRAEMDNGDIDTFTKKGEFFVYLGEETKSEENLVNLKVEDNEMKEVEIKTEVKEEHTKQNKYIGSDSNTYSNELLKKANKPKLIKMNKQYTIDREKVRLLCIDSCNEEYPVIALGSAGQPLSFTKEGYFSSSDNDFMQEYNLKEVPKPKAEYKNTKLYKEIKEAYKEDKIEWKEIKKNLKQVYYDLDAHRRDFSKSLANSFTWDSTEQGHEYWNKIDSFVTHAKATTATTETFI